MATTPADVAVNRANQIMAVAGQIAGLRQVVNDLVLINTDTPFGTGWNALDTVAKKTDGGVGAADTPGTPVDGHFVDPAKYSNIARLVSNTQLAAALDVVVAFQVFCTGAQVNANGARKAAINNVTG